MNYPDNLTSGSDSSSITLAIAPVDYSASRLALAVEDSDTQLMGLSIADTAGFDGLMQVTLKVNRLDPAPAIRSLERYGYRVVDATIPAVVDDDTARRRALELLHILER